MTLALPSPSPTASTTRRVARTFPEPAVARLLLALILCAAVLAGLVATGTEASSLAAARAGPELTRLLRAMTVIKALMGVAAAAAVFWRLSAPVTPIRFGAYALACAAMAAGPGLIWNMVHIGWGALVLHAGLLSTALLLWRDPDVEARLAKAVAARGLKRQSPPA